MTWAGTTDLLWDSRFYEPAKAKSSRSLRPEKPASVLAASVADTQ